MPNIIFGGNRMKSGQSRAAHRRQLLRRASVLGACIAAALAALPALAQDESGTEAAAGDASARAPKERAAAATSTESTRTRSRSARAAPTKEAG